MTQVCPTDPFLLLLLAAVAAAVAVVAFAVAVGVEGAPAFVAAPASEVGMSHVVVCHSATESESLVSLFAAVVAVEVAVVERVIAAAAVAA